ncbi:MAG: cell division topological specificity factor MinE [Syntrophomonadaceae bacterium]
MLAIFDRLFNRSRSCSRAQANQRLQVVLAQDRIATSTDKLEIIRNDVAQTVRRHLEISGEPQIRLLRQGRHTIIDINITVKAR